MDNNIFWVLDTEIKEGKTEEVKSLMNDLIDFTQKNEPGAIHYEWFLNSDGKKCTVFEHYADSDAAMDHLNSFGKNFGLRFMTLLAVKKYVVFGNPDEKLKNALDKLGCIYMKSIGGFARL